jgi:hypothetical protein
VEPFQKSSKLQLFVKNLQHIHPQALKDVKALFIKLADENPSMAYKMAMTATVWESDNKLDLSNENSFKSSLVGSFFWFSNQVFVNDKLSH